MNTRRQFLITAPMGALAAAIACRSEPQGPAVVAPASTPGAPPAFGTGPLSGPEVSPDTFAEAGKLAQVTMSSAEREMMAASWRRSMAPQLERRAGPRKVALDASAVPAMQWNPAIAGAPLGPAHDSFARSAARQAPLPRQRRRYRLRAGHAAVAMDRDQGAEL